MNTLHNAAFPCSDAEAARSGNEREDVLAELVELTGQRNLAQDRLTWLDNKTAALRARLKTLNGD